MGHLTKGNNSRFSKTIFFFLRADEYRSCNLKIRKSKAINCEEVMELDCILEFTLQKQFIDILDENLNEKVRNFQKIK